MEKLMANSNLTGSQLDLVMHGPNEPTGPGHCKSTSPVLFGKTKNVNELFLENEVATTSKLHNSL